MHSPMFQRRDLLDWEMLSPAVELQCEVGARSGSAETLAGGGPSHDQGQQKPWLEGALPAGSVRKAYASQNVHSLAFKPVWTATLARVRITMRVCVVSNWYPC